MFFTTGKVSEYYNLTQLTPTNSTTVMACGTVRRLNQAVDLAHYRAEKPLSHGGHGWLPPARSLLFQYYNYDRYGEIVLASSRYQPHTFK